MLEVFWLVLTYGCNNKCLYCYADCGSSKESVFMPIKYAFDVVDMMVKNNVKKCLLIGGEPTLYPFLPELIKFIRDNSEITTSLITNGRKLSLISYLDKLINSGLNRAVISIEGSSADVHNFITVAKSFDETIKAVENCLKKSLPVTTLTTINAYNFNDLLLLVKMLNNIGVKDIAFNCAIPTVEGNKTRSDFVVVLSDVARKMEEIYYFARDLGIKVNFNATIPICLISEKILEQMLADNSIAVGCQMYHGKGVAFDCLGNILPCTHLSAFPLFIKTISSKGEFIY